MANSMTQMGQTYALYGTATPNGGIANLAAKLKLMSGASTPNVNGTGFTEVASGNGYPSGGWAITRASWSLVTIGSSKGIQLANQPVVASGGNIPNVAGCWVEDASGNVLAWWERTASTIAPSDSVTITGLTIGG